ncbi:MAG: (d)CMP kinase [Clostridiaceae bacterium]|jgi:cytidylate kinase|nr:(d)CMP kinase [Clostridiaceae bacterium]
MSRTIQIAIDGPSGAGKSTMARLLAQQLRFVYVDTGAMYRAVGLFAQRAGVEEEEIEAILPMLNEIQIDIQYVDGNQRIFLGGEDVSEAVRTEKSGRYASAVSALPAVRQFLLGLQRRLAENQNVIMDGRDIGTVILPQAQVKIFLTASPEERARRRFAELRQKGQPADYDQVYQDLLERDQRDSRRTAAPLRPAADAVTLDATAYSLEETLERMKQIIGEKTGYAV